MKRLNMDKACGGGGVREACYRRIVCKRIFVTD